MHAQTINQEIQRVRPRPVTSETRPSPTPAAASGVVAGAPRELDDLLWLDLAALDDLYRRAYVPDLGAIEGDLRGRMLATTVLSGPRSGLRSVPLAGIAAAVRAWASSSVFPWRGKSFRPLGVDSGEGINRVGLDRVKVFRFETSIGPSRAGEFDALQLDYDLPENPRVIRMIKDELRQLRPGLYLGQAYLATRAQEHLVLFFALAAPSGVRT